MKHTTSKTKHVATATAVSHRSRWQQYALTALMLAALAGAVHAQDESQPTAPPQINLNVADAEALQYLPGIGPGKSAEIIRVREESGGFTAMEDLLQVPGIGEVTLAGFRPYATLEGGVATLSEEMAANPPSAAAHNASDETSGETSGGETASHE